MLSGAHIMCGDGCICLMAKMDVEAIAFTTNKHGSFACGKISCAIEIHLSTAAAPLVPPPPPPSPSLCLGLLSSAPSSSFAAPLHHFIAHAAEARQGF